MWKLIFPKKGLIKRKRPPLFSGKRIKPWWCPNCLQNHEKWDNKRVVKIEKKQERWNRFHRIYKDLNTKRKKSNSLGRFFSRNASTKTSSYIFVFDHSVFGDSSSFINQKKKTSTVTPSLHGERSARSPTLWVKNPPGWCIEPMGLCFSQQDIFFPRHEAGVRLGPRLAVGRSQEVSVVKEERMVFGEAAAGKACIPKRCITS